MGKIRKMRFESWKDAEEAYGREEARNSVLTIALNEIALGGVAWVESKVKAGRKIGTCRLDAPHGGVVIMVDEGYVTAQYVDEWVGFVKALPAPGLRDGVESYKQWKELRSWANQVKEDQALAMNKKYGPVRV